MEGSDGTVLLGYSVGRGGPAEGAGVGASGAELWVGGGDAGLVGRCVGSKGWGDE